MTSPRRSPRRSSRRVVLLGLVSLLTGIVVHAQVVGAADTMGRGLECSGIASGYGWFQDGGGLVPDALWGVMIAHFPSTHLGTAFTFEQNIRLPSVRNLGGDLVVQCPKQDAKGLIPFAHVGGGAVLFGPSDVEPMLSFGGGIKQYVTDRVGVRFGVQDRMSVRYPSAHLISFYGGAVVRF
ncbi:MAG: hypothetical protein IH939_12890 [Acidobacteria bacterium]|nr:hypothetical protein [Acidobacteriota bacterium]